MHYLTQEVVLAYPCEFVGVWLPVQFSVKNECKKEHLKVQMIVPGTYNVKCFMCSPHKYDCKNYIGTIQVDLCILAGVLFAFYAYVTVYKNQNQ